MMAVRRFAQGLGQQLQLAVLQITRHRTGYGGVEQGNAPIADVDHRFQQVAVQGGVGHDLRLIVVAGNPARRHAKGRGHLPEVLIGRQRTVLGQVPRGQQQVDPGLLLAHQADHPLQALAGVHAHQRGVGLGKQMAVGQLHQHCRCIGGHGGYAGQGALPRQSQEWTYGAIMLGQDTKRKPREADAVHIYRTTSNSWPRARQ